MADISIPEGDNPVRYQASLGGNQKYRNMGNVSGQAYLVRGQVTNVYYQKGTLDFNTYGSSVTSGVTDGSGSAPIPVDFWGKNTDGKVFGCYRPVQKGSQILVAYIGGDTSRPIVIGVYPDNESSYELISPVHYNTGDDSTDDVQNDALGERKIYPNQQMMYESGKGDILRSMGGKSFLYISENGSGYLDDINYAYDEIRDFYDADASEIEPTMTKAQSWLLVHEDNDSDEASDGHRTRFYVNRSGELMVTFANKDDPNNIVVLEASKDSGFKLTKRFDNSNIKEDSEDYVQFGIGNGNNVSIKSVDSGDATSFYLDNGNIKFNTPKEGSITFNGLSVDGLLGKVSDVESTVSDVADKVDNAARAGARAQSAASDAASQALAASMAGEDAKSAAVEAQAAGEDAKTQAEDTRNRIIYYSSISNEKDVAIPGKYIIVNTDTYIKNGTIKTAHIGDGAITNAKIANLAVGTAQLEDTAITRAKIGNLAVGTAQIEDAAITDVKVGNLSADKLTAGTIDFSVISGIHINASEIDVGKIVADQIFVNGLGDISKNLGTVTSGNITGTNLNSDVASAASRASAAKSAADSSYNYANSEMAVQSAATAKAQSAADSAFSQAKTAIDTGQVTSQAVKDLKDGSTLTIAELGNGLATKVANSEFATYKTQTDSQVAQMVTSGTFSAYSQATAELISEKVTTKDFSAYQATTAKAISSKVESKDFNTYKEQTDGAILSKVSKKDANNVNLIPYSAMPKADNLQWVEAGGGGTLSVATHVFYHNGADPLYELNTAGSNEVFAISPRFKINANATYTFQLKGFASYNVSSMDVYVLGRPNGSTEDYTVVQGIITGAVLSYSALDYRTVTFTTGAIGEAYIRIDNNGSTDGNISILGFTELKLEPGDTATPYVYGGQDSMISQMSDDINLRVTKDGLIDQINVQAGSTLISSSGQLTLSGKTIYFDTANPVIIPSANITGTLNGKTINAGNISNNANNTAKYYPMTITPDGAYKSTYFDSAVGLQSSVESGAISYEYRSMIGNGSGTYLYDTVAINGQGITLDSGTTNTKDTTFSAPEKETAYISLTTGAGLYLHGSNANIDFGGHLNDDSTSVGMYMNPYGNLIAKSASYYWQISVAGNDNTGGGVVARFGIDSAGSNAIEFHRNLGIGNFQINTGHTITSVDNGDIHFAKRVGGAANIYAGDVHYNSLVKSSLLSVKRDVQKADTAYWAQLVNSIDLATYQYKTDDNTSHLRLSSIVDDVNDTKQWQLPDVFISRDEKGKLCGVDDSVLLNATLATVQEQQKEIDQLNGHNMELEARLNKLEAKLNG